jgi:hypothetical protein
MNIEAILSDLYDEVDNLADDLDFDSMNELLIDVDIESSTVEYLIMALSVTLPHKDELPFRNEFFEMIKDKLERDGEPDIDSLLLGLE